MSVEQAIEKVARGMKVVLVPCKDERNRNVLRTTAFRFRNKIQQNKMLKVDIGITNFEADGEPFIKIYAKENSPLYTLGENGDLILLDSKKEDNFEELEILSRMAKDGKKDEYIFEIMTEQYGWEWEEVYKKLKILKPEEEKVSSRPLIPQDILKRKKLTKEDLV